MKSNLEKYKADLKQLITRGGDLFNGIQYECRPKEFSEGLKKIVATKHNDDKKILSEVDKFLKELPSFRNTYQLWYSESLILLKQILPDRLQDFIKYYERPKNRKAIEHSNYTIEDYLDSLVKTNAWDEIIVPLSSAIPKFEQQLNILKSVERRFYSTLFDIKQLVQADVFDSEIDTAKELLKNKFYRASGVVCGVILEKHLFTVCGNHNLTLNKKAPTLSDFYEILKTKDVIDTPTWRFLQRLSDIRNLCCHNKGEEPTKEQVQDLIDGVSKSIKTIF